MPLEKELAVAKQAVQLASQLCSATQKGLSSQETLDKNDKSPVTVADFGAQALVLNTLGKLFPEDPAVGEEDTGDLIKPENAELLQRIAKHVQEVDTDMDQKVILDAISRGGNKGGDQGRFWTLDPIDGTKGFLRGDQYAIALALIVEGEVQLGVLGCPNLSLDDGQKGCLLFAVKGQGAFQAPLNEIEDSRVIKADGIEDPSLASFCESVESGHTKHDRAQKIADLLGTKAEPFRMDSQCKYAVVSRGQASVYLRLPTRPGYEEKIWDHAAGYIILQEAGGRISDTLGNSLDFSRGRTLKTNKGIVATSPKIHEAVVKAVIASA